MQVTMRHNICMFR